MEQETVKDTAGVKTLTCMRGRRPVRTRFTEITPENIQDVLTEVLPIWTANSREASYLWRYYRGGQPILERVKEVRPEIMNTVVENHAQEIVAFKIGYQLAEPLQYTCRMQCEPIEVGKNDKPKGKVPAAFASQNPFLQQDDQETSEDDHQEPQDEEQDVEEQQDPQDNTDKPDVEQQDSEETDDEAEDGSNPFASSKPAPFARNEQEQLSEEEDADAEYERTLSQVNELNTLMFAEDKASVDRDLFEWMCVAGQGFRFIEADTEEDVEDGGAPFEIYTLDSRSTFVVESNEYHHRPLMGVWVGQDEDRNQVFNVYTKDTYYRIVNGVVQEQAAHTLGHIPIIEYRLNNARMGVFEPVLSLLDAINNLESNRLDDIEQNVQALLKFINCDVEANDIVEMLKLGAVKVKSTDPQQKSDIDVISTQLDQNGTQTVKDDLYQAVVNICGMPLRGGSGTADTGAAVLLRDGWTLAESHAKSYELQFKRAEREFLRVVLAICEQSADCDISLKLRDIELSFNRRNYENILVKAQVLTTMLQTNKVHPQLAFQACGLFTDPDAAYKQSQAWVDRNKSSNPLFGAATELIETQRLGSQPGQPEIGNDGNNGPASIDANAQDSAKQDVREEKKP